MHPPDPEDPWNPDGTDMSDASNQSAPNWFRNTSETSEFTDARPLAEAAELEQKINSLTEQLSELTRQLEQLKAGRTGTGEGDPFTHATNDPFAVDAAAPSDELDHHGELNEVFSKIKNSALESEERLVDECSEMPGAVDLDEELIEPEVTHPSLAKETREPESVAEILARMKASGQLESDLEFVSPGFGEDQPDAATGSDVPERSSASAAPPTAQPTESPKFEEDEDVDIQGYMSQLLSRIGDGATHSTSEEIAAPNTPSEDGEQDGKDTPEPVAPQTLMEPGEFRPSKMAPEKNANLAAMRELALESTRTAVTSSIERRRKAQIMVSISATLASFSAAGFFSLMSRRFGDVPSISAVALAIVGVGLLFTFAKTAISKNSSH